MTTLEKQIRLIKYFYDRKGETIDSYDETLQEQLGIGQRQLARELEVLSEQLDAIVETKKGRRKAYKLVKPVDVLNEAFARETLGLGMLFAMAKEGMPEVWDEWDDVAKKTGKPYSFFAMPYEDIAALEHDANFIDLKRAVERHEYRDIHLEGGKVFRAVKPIRLLFSEGNWYVAYVDGKELRISRISFIKQVAYAKGLASYQPSSISSHIEWLETKYQNPFSRYGVTPKTAVLKAAPNIAHYFDEGMKRFFKSQRFMRKEEDASVIFSVEYTQPMEILPFVRRWLPDLSIVKPKELYEAHMKVLGQAVNG